MKNTPIAWIPGGSRGIGFACASALARQGYALALSGRNRESLESAKQTLAKAGAHVEVFPCDIGVQSQVSETYRSITGELGVPTVLINSAGLSPWDTFTETSTQTFDAVIAANTRGMFLTSKVVLPDMYERKSGTIVQLLSIASTKAFKNGAAYVASKYASLGLTNALREEARKHGVRVIAVFPGATETELWGAEAREQHHARMMQPEDIAEAIVHALSQPGRTLIEEIVLRPIQGDI